MSKISARETFYGFIAALMDCFGDDVLSTPHEEDITHVLSIREAIGLPDCVRS